MKPAGRDLISAGLGRWVDELVVELHPYDAGTDSGASYTARNRPSNPRQPITQIQGPPFAVGGAVAPLGTFTFHRRSGP
jgi:hypothetical protein